MTEEFDPYYIWLGIPPHEQPPHHYRLLGLQLFESDPHVIQNAADRQMVHVKAQAHGRYGAYSQAILNHLSAARICLLNPDTRQAYDATLRQSAAAQQPPVPPTQASVSLPGTFSGSQPAPHIQASPIETSPAGRSSTGRKRPAGLPWKMAGIIVPPVVGLVLGYLILLMMGSEYDFLGLTSESSSLPDVESASKEPNPTRTNHPTRRDRPPKKNRSPQVAGRPGVVRPVDSSRVEQQHGVKENTETSRPANAVVDRGAQSSNRESRPDNSPPGTLVGSPQRPGRHGGQPKSIPPEPPHKLKLDPQQLEQQRERVAASYQSLPLERLMDMAGSNLRMGGAILESRKHDTVAILEYAFQRSVREGESSVAEACIKHLTEIWDEPWLETRLDTCAELAEMTATDPVQIELATRELLILVPYLQSINQEKRAIEAGDLALRAARRSGQWDLIRDATLIRVALTSSDAP